MATIKSKEKNVNVEDGKAIMGACEELGVPFGCKSGMCGTCRIEVIEGEENLSELTSKEKDMDKDRTHRLACQAEIKQDVVEFKF